MIDTRKLRAVSSRLLLLSMAVGAMSSMSRLANAGLKSEVVITTGLNLPIFAAAPPGDFEHLFVAEGTLARMQRLNLATNQLTTVLDLPNQPAGSQTGLNGFAFHPNFATNGKLYVNYSGGGAMRILEFTRSVIDPNVFDIASEREILTVANPSGSHNAGWIGFGPHDGLLYVSTGDGGNVGPLTTRGLPAQDVNSVQGKMLRIDVNGDDFIDDETRNYSVPPTNPFAEGGGAPEIFARGLRHSFQNGFDRLTGDLYIADVGSRWYEEINVLPAGTNGGQNYGWRAREGLLDNPDYPDAAPAGAIDPIHVYPNDSAAAVIGGYVYRGSAIPWLQGTYFFADFSLDMIGSLRYDTELNQVMALTDRTAELASPLGSYGGIASYAEDAAGELYLLDYARGDIYKIVAETPEETGDFNDDGVVDAADYVAWRKGLGGVPTESGYEVWRAHFAESTHTGSGSGEAGDGVTAVPEPMALVMAISCIAFVAYRKRSRNGTHIFLSRALI